MDADEAACPPSVGDKVCQSTRRAVAFLSAGWFHVIYVTRLDDSELAVNAELIETVEQRPDTVITLTTGRKLVVRQSVAEIIERVIAYRRQVYGERQPHWEDEQEP